MVKHGLAKELTYEEACARVDKAAEHGLMGQAVWVEVEQFLWGIRNDQMDQFLEICFCCPCCCIAMRLARNAQPEDRVRFHPAGWTAVPDRTKCIGCKQCVNTVNGCPVEAISFGEDGKININQELCVGCGICKNRCPEDVIKIKQTMPMRADLHEYFLKDYNLDLKLFDVQGAFFTDENFPSQYVLDITFNFKNSKYLKAGKTLLTLAFGLTDSQSITINDNSLEIKGIKISKEQLYKLLIL